MNYFEIQEEHFNYLDFRVGFLIPQKNGHYFCIYLNYELTYEIGGDYEEALD